MMATDPGSVSDMASWANRTGNEVVEHEEAAGIHISTSKEIEARADPQHERRGECRHTEADGVSSGQKLG